MKASATQNKIRPCTQTTKAFLAKDQVRVEGEAINNMEASTETNTAVGKAHFQTNI